MVTIAKIITRTDITWEHFTSNALLLYLHAFVNINSADPETAEISIEAFAGNTGWKVLVQGTALRQIYAAFCLCADGVC